MQIYKAMTLSPVFLLLVLTGFSSCKAFSSSRQFDTLKFSPSQGQQSVRVKLVSLADLDTNVDSIIDVKEDKMELATGVVAQVLSCSPSARKAPKSGFFGQIMSTLEGSKPTKKRPPLVFVHGSFHAGWCWTEKYFPYFVSLGYPVVALSLRGTGGTFAGENVKKVKITEHASDVQAFLEKLPSILGDEASKPILISHSFGCAVVMKYLEKFPDEVSRLGGVVTMCPVPPSGNGPMTMRFLRRSLVKSWKIIAGFALQKAITDPTLCRELFFGGDKQVLEDGTVEDYGVSDEDIARYQGYFRRDTDAIIDVSDFVKNLPSDEAIEGRAPFLSELPPCLVIGATRDNIVDQEGVDETAFYFGLDEAVMVDSPHDVMLGCNWQKGAEAMHDWLDTA